MKRVLLHIAFWIAYLVQDALLQFLWVEPSLTAVPEKKQLWMAFETSLLSLFPKLIFSYYVMYFALDRILTGKSRTMLVAAEVILVLIASVVLYRVISIYYVLPHIYAGLLKSWTVFDARAVLVTVMQIGFVSATAITFKLLRTQLSGKDREKRLVKEKLEAELKFLRNQTNPHFLFNTLNNIYGLVRPKSQQTAEIVMKLSKLLRFMIYESKKDLISIAQEIKMLEDYIELEKIRYDGRLTITFQKEIDDDSRPVAPLLLMPLIENAFKHGASESRLKSFIHIRVKLSNDHLRFEIENSKEDFATDKPIPNIGLSNLGRQLELIYRDYNLEVNNEPTFFEVNLTINLASYAKV